MNSEFALTFEEPLSEKTGQASRMGVGRFPSFFSCFLVSVSDVERQYFYIQTPYSFRDPTTPPPPKSAVTDEKSGKIPMLNLSYLDSFSLILSHLKLSRCVYYLKRGKMICT